LLSGEAHELGGISDFGAAIEKSARRLRRPAIVFRKIALIMKLLYTRLKGPGGREPGGDNRYG
jgi:hypothetical protein